ncbi:MAG TPA: UdgX family uracil-DNA binding protein [Polyangiaceae bacterium]
MIAAKATDFETWRTKARELLEAGTPPEDVAWTDATQASLFSSSAPAASTRTTAKVPPEFLKRAEIAADHADPDKYATLYRLLWKITHGRHDVLSDPLDPDTAKLNAMLKAVREEEHDMHAFVRFRRVVGEDGAEHWVAWYAPKHPVLKRVAPFFARRYPAMAWTLMTPELTAHWDTKTITFGEGAPRDHAPSGDELDALFLTYYGSIFNPARVNLDAMSKHLPARVLSQIPEGAVVSKLVRESVGRVDRMRSAGISASAAIVPASRDLHVLARAACECRACPIGENATQAVFGQGPTDARLMVVGEQPGDQEDLEGRPFVGPAGKLLDELFERAGIPRPHVYMTNAVKHFKWEPRGKRRLHSRPLYREVQACRGWLDAEVEIVKPKMILCLGATAAQSFAGSGFRVQRDRGKPQSAPWADWWMATYHPSALLRAEGDEARRKMESEMLADLILTREKLESLSAA